MYMYMYMYMYVCMYVYIHIYIYKSSTHTISNGRFQITQPNTQTSTWLFYLLCYTICILLPLLL